MLAPHSCVPRWAPWCHSEGQGGREGWAGPSQVDTVVQAQPSCIKARAGAEQRGTHEFVRDGKALPGSPGTEAGRWIGKGGVNLKHLGLVGPLSRW